MRVMQVVKELRHGGAETVALDIMREGVVREHEQAVVSAPGEWSARFPGRHYPMGRTSLKPQDILAAARRIRAAVRVFRPDVVHAHSPGTVVAAAVALGPTRPVPLLTTAHGGYSTGQLSRQGRLYSALKVPVVSCGPGVTSALTAAGYAPLRTINNGIPASGQSEDGDRDLVREFDLSAGRGTVIAVGRVDPVKNQEQLLRAAALLPGVNVLICGDGAARPGLEELTDSLGLRDRVRFLGMRTDVASLIRHSDAQVLTSRVEGLPMALLEGMAEGGIVVATDVLGTRELVEHERNGLLVPLDDVAALAFALDRALTDGQLRQTLSAGALRTAADYSLQAMTEAYWDLYAELA